MALSTSLRASLSAPRCINLSYNMLGPEGGKSIAESIAVSASLTDIDLSFNNIGSQGAKAIAKAISVSASLTSIDIKLNNIGENMTLNLVEIIKNKRMVSVGHASCNLAVGCA